MELNPPRTPPSVTPTVTLVVPSSSQTVTVHAFETNNLDTIHDEANNGGTSSETNSSDITYRPSTTGVLPHRTPRAEPPQSILVNRGAPHIYDDQNNQPNSGEVQSNQPRLFLSRPSHTHTGRRIHDRHEPPNNTNNAIPANVIQIPTPSTSRSSMCYHTREPRLPPNSRAGSPTLLDPTEDNPNLPNPQGPVFGGPNIIDLEDLPPLHHSHALV